MNGIREFSVGVISVLLDSEVVGLRMNLMDGNGFSVRCIQNSAAQYTSLSLEFPTN